jgi:hypothetical protein
MSKSNPRSKIRKNHVKRMSSTKRKQELEDVNLIDSKTKAFKNYDKVKRVLEISMKGIDREKQVAEISGITSPHFYKPHKNKLFYIPKSSKIRKSLSRKKDRAGDNVLIQESTKDQFRKHLLTEVNSPLYQPEFDRTMSPGNNINFKILSTKNTTEEDDLNSKAAEFLFSKTAMNKGMLKDLIGNNKRNGKFRIKNILIEHDFYPKPVENSVNDDSIQSCVHMESKSKKSETSSKFYCSSSAKGEVPSMKDIKGENSCSTIDKIMPNELMEDSMNTCSLNKASSKRTSKKTIESTVHKEENFIGTLSDAINYFTTPQLKMKKTPKSKTRIMNYNSLVSPKNKEMKQSLSQMGKKCSKFMTKKLKGNISYANKSWIENTNSSVEFRSPNRVFKTNLNKFNTDKVLKTENDALLEEQTFYLMGKNY